MNVEDFNKLSLIDQALILRGYFDRVKQSIDVLDQMLDKDTGLDRKYNFKSDYPRDYEDIDLVFNNDLIKGLEVLRECTINFTRNKSNFYKTQYQKNKEQWTSKTE